jgi:long-chain fatty acid transport protein
LRAGVEVRPTADVRVEAAYVRELWSSHRAIDAYPKDIALEGIVGAPPSVKFPDITIPRNFRDTSSYRLGAEVRFEVAGYALDLRAGASYEQSGVPPAYLSLSSLDFDKVTTSLGGSIHVGARWRFDVVYAHLFASTVVVDPKEAQIPRINPLKGNAPLEAVNGGTYSASADLIGVGLNYRY